MLRSTLIALLLLCGIYANAQNPQTYLRKMETIGYASVSVSPNIIYTSFVIKEYQDNGKIVTIKESEEKLKKIVKSLSCTIDNINVGNIYGYITYNGPNNEEGIFEHKRLYLLKLSSVECIDLFLDRVDPRALESFNIDEMDNDNIDAEVRQLQLKAFAKAKDKASVLLATYGEQCGRVLDIQEVNRFITYPDFTGKGSRIQVVNMSGTSNYDAHQIRTKNIKIEYEVKIVFEIK